MKNKTQNGNVLFLILIAVGLFGALGFAVSGSLRGSGGSIDEEYAKTYASELIGYADSLTNAVAQLHLRGCADNEISFDTPELTGYDNGNAPSDETCHVFSPKGGGVRYVAPDDSVNDGDGPLATWYFDGRLSVADTGYCDDDTDASCKDLKVLLRVKKQICDQINLRITGQTRDLTFTPDEDLNLAKFDGTYSADEGMICEDGTAMRSWCAHKKAFCGLFDTGTTGASAPHYTFIKVLRAR